MSQAADRRTQRPFRGRARELAQLSGLMEEALRGNGGAALVVGEAGVGKTRLLEEATALAPAGELTVVRVNADEVDSMAPLSTLVRALADAVPAVLSAVEVTALRLQAGAGPSVVRDVQSLLERASVARPVLVVVDDVDAADELTVHALRLLVPELTSSPVTWLLSAKPTGAARIAGLRAAVVRAAGVVVPLQPAADDVVAQIIADVLGAPPAPSLIQSARGAGGNLFLILEMLHGAVAEGVVTVTEGRADLAEQAVPQRLDEAVKLRLAGLSPDARHLLDVAAVVGRFFRLDDVLALLGRSTSGSLPSVREVLDAGIVVPSGAAFAFGHDLIRRGVLNELPPPLLASLHREVARLLLEAGAPAVEVAGHVLAGAAPGDRRAVDLLCDAAERLRAASPQQAADLYRQALNLAAADIPRWLELVLPAARALIRANRLAETHELLGSAIGAGFELDREAQLRVEISEASWIRGRYADAMDVLRPVTDRVDLSAPVRTRVTLSMARTLAVSGKPSDALAALDGAMEGARQSGDRDSVGFALATRSYALRFAGRFAESLDVATEAVKHRGDAVSERLPEPRVWLARSLSVMDQLSEAERVCVDLMRDARVTSDVTSLPAAHATYARLLLAQGRVPDAATEAEAGIAALQLTGGNPLGADLHACAATALWLTGDQRAAHQVLERGEETLDGSAFGVGHLALARVLLAGPDDAPSAMAVAEPLIDELGETFGQLVFDPIHGPALVRTAKAAQDLVRAERVVRAADRLAAMNADVGSWRVAADHANGLLAGDVARVRSAVHGYSAAGRPLAAAIALADVVDLLSQRQDRDAATVRQEAMAGFTALGADGSASRLAGMRLPEPVRSGETRPMKRPRAERPKFGWDSLTEAELRVVVLAATGATNKEIASRLWLSPYTVDTHMRHSLSKLGLRSRVALARLAGERGLMAPPEAQ